MKAEDIKNILIVGSGTMGRQIAVICAVGGCSVAVYDISDEILEKSKGGIRKLIDFCVAGKRVTPEQGDEAFSRIRYSSDPASASADADLLSESVPEDPALKKKVFAQFNSLCPAKTIFTTNTSTLFPSMFAADTGRPEKFLAFHFHDMRITTVVDVMPHPGTNPEVTETVARFAELMKQAPIVLKKESMGYVFNKMLSALFYAAQTIAANDIASPEDVDRAWMGVTHMMMGPFGIMDSVGIDTVHKITEYWAVKNKDPQGMKNTEFLKKYLDEGRAGQKSGLGFYKYPEPEFRKPGFVAGAVKRQGE
jgi:3-hydroxybutyryl-CoA dehydrogenase